MGARATTSLTLAEINEAATRSFKKQDRQDLELQARAINLKITEICCSIFFDHELCREDLKVTMLLGLGQLDLWPTTFFKVIFYSCYSFTDFLY